MNILRQAFSRRHLLKTVLILVLVVAFVRLGVWQLSRHQERVAANAVLEAQLAEPSVLINEVTDSAEWGSYTDRTVSARGAFDFDNQMVLVQQRALGRIGVHLVTPLLLDGAEQAVLVDRGWTPSDAAAPGEIDQFDVPGTVTLDGFVQATERLPRTADGGLDSAEFEREIFQVNIPRLQTQLPYDLLPVYLLQAPDDGALPSDLPYREAPQIDLSNGPHLGYAVQWFSFALVAVGFYAAYLRRADGAKGKS